MIDAIFNVSNLSPILEDHKIESTYTNCYLFFLFFLQRSQLISNVIKIISPSINNTFRTGIKYCLMNENDHEKILKKMKEFRSELDKSDLINEILKFIKSSINEKSSTLERSSSELALVKYEDKICRKSSKIEIIFQKNNTIMELIDSIENSFIFDENDIHDYLQCDLINEISNRDKLENDINLIEKKWESYNGKKTNEIYKLLNHWFEL